MIPRPSPPLNLSRRDYFSPNSSAGPLIGAIVGVSMGVFVLSPICFIIIGRIRASQSSGHPGKPMLPRPPTSNLNSSNSCPGAAGRRRLQGPSRPGGYDTGGPHRPHDQGPRRPRPIVLPPPSVTSDNSGGYPFGPGIYPPGTWPIHDHRIPVDVRWNQRRDPRRIRSEHRL